MRVVDTLQKWLLLVGIESHRSSGSAFRLYVHVRSSYVAMELCFIFITAYFSLYKHAGTCVLMSLGIFDIHLIEVVDVGDYVQDRPAR